MKKIFVSFRYSDTSFKNDLLNILRESDVELVTLLEDVSMRGENGIRAEILDRINRCRGLLVVVGDDVHNSKWLDYEVQVARSARLPCLAVRHPQSRGGLPNRHRDLQLVEWNPANLAAAIRGW